MWLVNNIMLRVCSPYRPSLSSSLQLSSDVSEFGQMEKFCMSLGGRREILNNISQFFFFIGVLVIRYQLSHLLDLVVEDIYWVM